MKELQVLQAEIAKNRDVEKSAIDLITGLAIQIEANKNDPETLQRMADDLKAQSTELANAVTANTVAAPAKPKTDPEVDPNAGAAGTQPGVPGQPGFPTPKPGQNTTSPSGIALSE